MKFKTTEVGGREMDSGELVEKTLTFDSFGFPDSPERNIERVHEFIGRLLEFFIEYDLMSMAELNAVLDPLHDVKEIIK